MISDVFSNTINNQQVCLHCREWQRLWVVVMHTQSWYIGFFWLLSLGYASEFNFNFLKMQLLYTGLNNTTVEGFVELCDVSWCVCVCVCVYVCVFDITWFLFDIKAILINQIASLRITIFCSEISSSFLFKAKLLPTSLET